MTSKDREIVGNYEVSDQGIMTRREVLMMGAMAAGGLLSAAPAMAAAPGVAAAAATGQAASAIYVAKDFSNLTKGMDGFSASQIEQHLKLYKGYIGKSNEIYDKLKEVDLATANATYSPLRELLMEESFAMNGAIYHEFYFGNLGGKGGEPTGDLKNALEDRWGSTGKFMDYLKAAGKSMRGWVVIGYNTRGSHLSAFGLDSHNMWAPANVVPILVLDVYEHAYMVDYGIERPKYLDAFVKNLDWDVVAKRFDATKHHPSGAASTT
ncbi:MAG: Fe-Mn family superoxide dismutase [Candidatus Obscuribacterales bacterium]|nr:Fe-Mn family superoxide dismutase [Candidatus Obscuribacterales bacterium]